VSTLTGGIQINENGSVSSHYSGAAVDIIPVGDSNSDWEKIESFVKSKGYSPRYESFKKTGDNYIKYKFTEDYSDAQGCGIYYENNITSLRSIVSMPRATCYFGHMHVSVHGS